MGKFSLVDILDSRQNYIIGLSVFVQGCSEEAFTGAYQVSGTTKGYIVLNDLQDQAPPSEDTIPLERILVVLGYPEDFQIDVFEDQLIPYVRSGISVLIVVEAGYERIEKLFPDRVKRLPLQKVFEPALDWSRKMSEILMDF